MADKFIDDKVCARCYRMQLARMFGVGRTKLGKWNVLI